MEKKSCLRFMECKNVEELKSDIEKYRLALFMVVRNSIVMPNGKMLGKASREINQMSIRTCREILTSINFDEARKEYEDGIE